MKHIFYALTAAIFLTACIKPEKVIILQSPDSRGVEKDAPIILNGKEIGKVKEVTIGDQYLVFMKLHITDDVDLPDDSRISIRSGGLFGNKQEIHVEPGSSSTFLAKGDTVKTYTGIKDILPFSDDIIDRAGEFIESMTGEGSMDSIIREVEKVFEDLEDSGFMDEE